MKMFDDEVKNSLLFLARSEQYEELIRKLFIINNSYDINNEIDKNYILFMLSKALKQINRIDEAKIYCKQAKKCIENHKECAIENIKTLWLYIELYKDEMSKEELLDNYEKLKELSIFDEVGIQGLDCSIAFVNGDMNKVEKIFRLCLERISLDRHYIDIVKSILQEAYNINSNIYCLLDNIYKSSLDIQIDC